MYIAKRIGDSFHITSANGAQRGMRANSKLAILRMITKNFGAVADMRRKGFVTITSDTGSAYSEIQVTVRNGKLFIVNSFNAKGE
jgi:hypothetical protein